MMHVTRDFVSTVYVVHNEKVLLVFHKKLNKWLPPGGHINPNELPEDAAVREVKEETGLDIEIISNKPNEYSYNVKPLFTPEFIQLEDISEGHQHVDLLYLAVPKTDEIKIDTFELKTARWFSIAEMKKENVMPTIQHQAKAMIEKARKLHQ